ncbi:MAG: DNA adenine methylase [archaeon]|jgi:DNA adenine methylase
MNPKPFVKWAGGKRQLVQELIKFSPKEFGNYFEPFFGGGALFFELCSKGLIKHAFLNDCNEELITAYKVVKESPSDLIKELSKSKYKCDEKTFYSIRAENPTDPVKATARFIYLNRTAFNGLYRVNSKGGFNVPFGKHKNPRILDKENLLAVSEALQKDELTSLDFAESVKKAKKGDFVYFDPPYAPLNKSSFTTYTKNNFTEFDQKRLLDKAIDLHKKGCFVMISNSHTQSILDLYKDKSIFTINTVHATRMINCKAKGRGKIKEVVITNY